MAAGGGRGGGGWGCMEESMLRAQTLTENWAMVGTNPNPRTSAQKITLCSTDANPRINNPRGELIIALL
jgi:hypothetical protein